MSDSSSISLKQGEALVNSGNGILSSAMPGTDTHEVSIWEDWSGRGSHAEFDPNEVVPLEEGRFLGSGVTGGVYETHCKGVAVAWKRRFCRRKIGDAEKKELNILKKLQHKHIIKLVGTYSQGPILGLLLFPVAVCDLATFFEDVETLFHPLPKDAPLPERLEKLGLRKDETLGMFLQERFASTTLASIIGCLASAIQYLHSQRIRHKDLKPSNVLLSKFRIWLTDFGAATDFSQLSQSETDRGDRGTPKYFAPEVANWLPSGRAADIFSLGCIYLEIVTLICQIPLKELKLLRPAMDSSFQANLDHVDKWFELLQPTVDRDYRSHLLIEIRRMLNPDPQKRPSAEVLLRHLLHVDHLGSRVLFGHCCSETFVTETEHNIRLEQAIAEVGNELSGDLYLAEKQIEGYVNGLRELGQELQDLQTEAAARQASDQACIESLRQQLKEAREAPKAQENEALAVWAMKRYQWNPEFKEELDSFEAMRLKRLVEERALNMLKGPFMGGGVIAYGPEQEREYREGLEKERNYHKYCLWKLTQGESCPG